ncbi:MAG: exodeoxyribonuclease VII large subunit [Alphaproteobacteria bacterium]|nr:exodeoxyribonuclease VII large subunit [Alphaproteobacteria bacterium]
MSDEHKSSPAPGLGTNLPEYTVGEISGAVKRTLETAFQRVRVRGELSGVKRHSSGHLYFALKDADGVMDSVCWRGQAARLPLRPEDGMEVIATGRITTYADRSKYQMVVESMELAGQGALLALIEERKRRLAAEGLFDPARKQPIPMLPQVIGVVTSPTGAVIRDILHRLADRFPRRVLVWPVAVQGTGAAEQVARALAGFDRLPSGGVPRPDVVIVARGGGSIEDLMAFNEEVVVRAVAACRIPVISAVGHETDTTLIDYVADRRAPTPTAAAEMAVPVRVELLQRVLEAARRLIGGLDRAVSERRLRLASAARALPDPAQMVEVARQRLDDRVERLTRASATAVERRRATIATLGARLPHPRSQVAMAASRLAASSRALDAAFASALAAEQSTQRLAGERLAGLATRLTTAGARRLADPGQRLTTLARMLDTLSYRATLARGYAVLRAPDGTPLTTTDAVTAAREIEAELTDGRVALVVGGAVTPPSPAPGRGKRKAVAPQPGLFDR